MTGNALVALDGVRCWFPIQRGVFSRTVGHVKAVDNVSLDVRPGETLGLVGESGCGKTTLGRCILRLEKVRSGRILYKGQDLLTLNDRDMRPIRRSLQMIFQDPFASLNPRFTVMDIVTEGLAQHGLLQGSREDAAMELLEDVGMNKEALYRYPHEFSGGQRQRISVARALALKPELIVCDEAVSALDVSIQAQVLNLLKELREKHGLAYLFISHDLSVVRHISHRIAVMYLGEIVEVGATGELMERPLHPYTQALISAVPVPGKAQQDRIVLSGDVPSAANPPSGCRFHTRCPHAVDRCRAEAPAMRSVDGRDVACHLV